MRNLRTTSVLIFVFKFEFYTKYTAYCTVRNLDDDELALRLPNIAHQMQTDLYRKTIIDTKCNYISVLKDWCIFAALNGVEPMDENPLPKNVIYWYYTRLNRLKKGANSIETWQSALKWLIRCLGATPTFTDSWIYHRHKEAIEKLHKVPTAKKLPFRLDWIYKWACKIGVTPQTWQTCNFDDLLKVFYILIIYFTISRPSEIHFTDKTENADWEIITTGLRLKDVRMFNQLLHIQVWWYKNQEFRNVPKHIYIDSPTCTASSCKCRVLDFYTMFPIVIQRRRQMCELLKCKLSSVSTRNRYSLIQAIEKLQCSGENLIFVNSKGSVWNGPKLSKLFKEIKSLLKIPNPEFYPPYSLKNGAMSMVNLQQIPLLKTIKYVAWSVKSLPHMSQRYIKINIQDMCTIPYEMIHGAIKDGDKSKCIDLSNNNLVPFDLRETPEISQMWV